MKHLVATLTPVFLCTLMVGLSGAGLETTSAMCMLSLIISTLNTLVHAIWI